MGEYSILWIIILPTSLVTNPIPSIGLPALLGYGKVNHFEFMVMPLYGRTLKEIMLG